MFGSRKLCGTAGGDGVDGGDGGDGGAETNERVEEEKEIEKPSVHMIDVVHSTRYN